MWIIWSLVSILLFSFSAIFEKKGSSVEEECTELKFLVWFGIFSFLVAVCIQTFGLRELDSSLFEFIKHNPAILLCPVFYMLSLLFLFLSLKFIPLSINVPITSTNGIYCFAGAIILYAALGKFQEVREEVSPIKVVLVIAVTLTIAASSILYNRFVHNNYEDMDYRVLKKKTPFFVVAGIIFAIISALCDASDSVVTYYILEEVCSSFDYIFIYYLMSGIIASFAYIILNIKTRKLYNPFAISEKNRIAGSGLDCLGTVTSNLAVALNPFFADPLISTYFIFTILFSRIIMREKFDKRQYLCVAVILACVVFFALLDR